MEYRFFALPCLSYYLFYKQSLLWNICFEERGEISIFENTPEIVVFFSSLVIALHFPKQLGSPNLQARLSFDCCLPDHLGALYLGVPGAVEHPLHLALCRGDCASHLLWSSPKVAVRLELHVTLVICSMIDHLND